MSTPIAAIKTETISSTKRSAVSVGALLAALRSGSAVLGEELGVDRRGLTITMKLRVAPTDVEQEQAVILLGFVVDKLRSAHEEIDRLRGVTDEGL